MTDLTLDDLDVDGALGEAVANVHGESRAAFLRRAVVGGGALLGAFALTPRADAQVGDVDILNFALTLEFLQADFYTEVEQIGNLNGPLERQSRIVGAHERAHVKAFREVLGRRAIKKPNFDFRGATETPERFRRTAVAFEDLAVAAYKGQAPRIKSRAYLASALAIHAVEARHAAWIRHLAGVSPVVAAFDEPLPMRRVDRIVNATNFVVDTRSRSSPRFTG